MSIAMIIALYYANLFWRRDLPLQDVVNGHYIRPAPANYRNT